MSQNPNIKKYVFVVGLGKGGMIVLQFVSSVILARMLTPEDYGITAMLAIFVSISNMLADSGFGGSIIYQKQVDDRDYSTVFLINMAISLALYGLMFIFSGAISSFYGIPEISTYIKVLGLVVVFNALGHIQFNQLYRDLEFNKINIVNIFSFLVASIVSIILAYYGFGVWALICLQVLNSVVSTIIYIILNRFVPELYFSWNIVRKHWSFGSGLFFSTILKTIYDNMYLQLIGKYAEVRSAGLYNQANKLKDIPSSLFSSTFETSLFPIFSKIQNEEEYSVKFRRVSRVFAFICCPLFILMGLLAAPIIELLLGNKWLEASSLLSILSVGAIFYIMECVNRSGLKSKGQSMLIFKMDLIKRIVSILIMVVALLLFGIYGLAVSYIINSFIGWMVNSVCLSKFTTYNTIQQLIDVIKPTIIAIILAFIFYTIGVNLFELHIFNILVIASLFIIAYVVTCAVIRDPAYSFVATFIKIKFHMFVKISYIIDILHSKNEAFLRRLYIDRFACHGKNLSFTPSNSDFIYNHIHIGDDVHIGPHACFMASIAHIYIGNKVVFGPAVTIRGGDHVFDIPGRFIRDVKDNEKRPSDDKDVHIEDDVWVGTNVTILKGVTIGRGSIIAAGALVTKDVPPYSVMGGTAKKLKNRFSSIEDTLLHERTLFSDNRLDDNFLLENFNR